MNFARVGRALAAVAVTVVLTVSARDGGSQERTPTTAAPAQPPEAAAVAPATFLAVGSSARTVSLGWTVPAASATYAVERRTDNSAEYTRIATLNASAGGYVDSGLAPHTTYRYRLSSVGAPPRVLISGVATTSGDEPVTTPAGTPLGEPNRTPIGPAGGRVSSPDGRISLDIAPDSLPVDSVVDLQPTTNTAPDGHSAALRVRLNATPSRPVALQARYDDARSLEADGLRLGVQRGDGSWLSLPLTAVDKRTRTLRATLPVELLATGAGTVDFTVVQYLAVSLAPREPRVQVGGTRELVPWARIRGYDLAAGSCDVLAEGLEGCLVQPVMAARRAPFLNTKPGYARAWYVALQEGGDATLGTIAPQGEVGATFTAPQQVPGRHRVRVSFQSTHERTGRSVVLASAIDIVGAP